MTVSVIGLARDLRTNTPVIYAQMATADYLNIVGHDFENFSIQRRRETHKAYERLKADIRSGALLPSITLAVKPEYVDHVMPLYQQAIDSNDVESLSAALSEPGRVDILDGLQRTYILSDLRAEGHVFVHGQTILVEFWLEGDLQKLIYRIIVLNAGQKPMSIRHQIELLFMSLKTSIEARIDQLSIYTERENSRRRRPMKFPLAVVVSGYQAFITGSAELKKDNIIASQMLEANALDATEEEIGEQFNDFVKYLSIYTEMDREVFRVYSGGNSESDGPDLSEMTDATKVMVASHWLAAENVFVAFFAAIVQYGNIPDKRHRIDEALNSLVASLRTAGFGADPLHLETFDKVRAGSNPRKVNVGIATRKLLTNGFKEFFRDAGETTLDRCWQLAAE
ncbi:hypothetical protein [Agrobacterium sp.]|uniref:hypothetical protein n=1 Tax=Agrobacterium sp. TaxID=361 RepID=UPI0028A83AEC|nr:hypothetical protein [Agrobacterium sp.]